MNFVAHILIMYSLIHNSDEDIVSRLFVAGINFQQSTVTERSLFSADKTVQTDILCAAKESGMLSLFILSTCNRTELYGYCSDETVLIELLLAHTKGTRELFSQSGFVKHGSEALEHLFKVASGLESQIVGDNEILGQLKSAIQFSRNLGMIGPVMDRTLNFALQASKAVRTKTKISKGSVSVAYAAIEWLREIPGIQNKKMLLYGAGKFGTTLAKNCKQYFPSSTTTIINRTDTTAKALAQALSVSWKPIAALENEVKEADIIVVCTNAPEYTLTPEFFSAAKEQWVLDLSVPENVHPSIKNLATVKLTGLDEVSQYLQTTLAMRMQEIPKAYSIILEYQDDFYTWLKWQRHVPVINDMRAKLYTLGEIHFCSVNNQQIENDSELLDDKVNRTVGSLARNLRLKHEKGCHYINAINEFLEQDINNG